MELSKEEIANLMERIAITQGELTRLMAWGSRLYNDLEKLKREVLDGYDSSVMSGFHK
jgi:hypothetical protein